VPHVRATWPGQHAYVRCRLAEARAGAGARARCLRHLTRVCERGRVCLSARHDYAPRQPKLLTATAGSGGGTFPEGPFLSPLPSAGRGSLAGSPLVGEQDRHTPNAGVVVSRAKARFFSCLIRSMTIVIVVTLSADAVIVYVELLAGMRVRFLCAYYTRAETPRRAR
jgi:hypothetical protein